MNKVKKYAQKALEQLNGAFPGQCLNLDLHYTTGRNRVNIQD